MTQEARGRWLASLGGSAIAETIALPFDVLKTRLQIAPPNSGGVITIFKTTLNEGGPKAFFKGLAPALLRQMGYHPLSMVIYEPLRNFLNGNSSQSPSYFIRLLSGGTAGGFSIFCFNWSETIKVQMQASKQRETIAGVAKRIYSSAGILGFWAGAYPNVVRTFIVNAAELGSYDQIKTEIFVPLVGNTPLAHIGASGCAGVISALASTPVDVVKTRLMNAAGRNLQPIDNNTSIKRRGFVSIGYDILKNEGLITLYSGFLPIVIRKIIWCSAFFVSYEACLPYFTNLQLFK
jgi:hypothetical protein